MARRDATWASAGARWRSRGGPRRRRRGSRRGGGADDPRGFRGELPWLQRASSDPAPAYRLDDGTTPPAYGIRGSLREDVGSAMLTLAGYDLAKEKVAARDPAWRAKPIPGASFGGEVATREDRVVSHNVIGVLAGTDAAAGSILYGAHWDAYGENDFDPPADRIRNGAVDNATGTATLLEVARAFTAGPRPRRSVVFGLWTAEEKGLLGATDAAHPLLPLATTAAQFNLDPRVVFPATRTLELIGPGKTPLEADLSRIQPRRGGCGSCRTRTARRAGISAPIASPSAKGNQAVLFPRRAQSGRGGGAAGEAWRAQTMRAATTKPAMSTIPEWDLTGAAQEGSVALALGREIAGSTRWPGWNADAPYAAVRAASGGARR
ncbi:M28 family peptidase [Sphingomonas sp. MMS24-JH45]